jgi:hypothetical protein
MLGEGVIFWYMCLYGPGPEIYVVKVADNNALELQVQECHM